MTFEDIKDRPYGEVNELLGGAVDDGLLSRQDGWRLISEHIDYHEPSTVIERLQAEVEDLRAQLKAVNDEMADALLDAQKTGEERDYVRESLDQANKVIALANDAMNHMGDKCNAADIVTDDDIAATEEAFDAVQEWQARGA